MTKNNLGVSKRPYHFKPFEELDFSDDFMFKKVMSNKEICAGVIERLLKVKVANIEYPELQKEIAPYYTSKGVRLDVYVKDSDRVFDIEMQTVKFDEIGKRTRYYQSMIDIDDLMKGANYLELKESYVIFICKDSPFEGFDLPVCTFKNVCLENSAIELGDKSHKMIYNASAYEKENDEELKTFLRFVCKGSAEDNFTERIKVLIAKAKETEANKTEYMAVNLHDFDIQWAARMDEKFETARKLLFMGLKSEQIAEATSLPLDKVHKLQSELQMQSNNAPNTLRS